MSRPRITWSAALTAAALAASLLALDATAMRAQSKSKPKAPAAQPGHKLEVATADSAPTVPVILRETYEYSRDGRRDPFVSLLTTNELRPAISDLRLTSILYDPTRAHSVAILRDVGTNAQYRVTEGTTLGRMRVSAIRVHTVVFTIDEFGTTRQDSLSFGDSTKARAK